MFLKCPHAKRLLIACLHTESAVKHTTQKEICCGHFLAVLGIPVRSITTKPQIFVRGYFILNTNLQNSVLETFVARTEYYNRLKMYHHLNFYVDVCPCVED
jgi:hypothetical protein